MDPLQKLSALTYAVQHCPNCPKPFLIRLVGPGAGSLDYKTTDSSDIQAYGMTLEETVEAVLMAAEERSREFLLSIKQ